MRACRSRLGFLVLLRGRGLLLDTFEMIVHGHGQSFLGLVLADAVGVELAFDFTRPRDGETRLLLLALQLEFAVEDVLAKDDAIVADINSGAGNELSDFGVRFAAEAAHRDIRGSGHSDSGDNSGRD